jgi:hypothetical protein
MSASFEDLKATIRETQTILDGALLDAVKAETPLGEEVYVQLCNLSKQTMDQADKIRVVVEKSTAEDDDSDGVDRSLYREVRSGNRTIVSLVSVLASQTEDEQCRAMVAMMYLISRVEVVNRDPASGGEVHRIGGQEEMVRAGAIPLLLAILNGRNEAHTVAATVLLEQLAYKNRRCQEQMLEEGVVPAMLAQLQSEYPRVKQYSADALRVMMRSFKECQTAVVVANGVEGLVPLTSIANSISMKRAGVRALANLSSIPDAPARLCSINAIPNLVSLLRISDTKTQECAAIVLSRVIADDLDRLADVAVVGGVEVIVGLLRTGSDDLKEVSLHMLGIMAQSSVEYKAALVAEGTVHLLVNCIRNGDDTQQQLAENVLERLSAVDNESVAAAASRAASGSDGEDRAKKRAREAS